MTKPPNNSRNNIAKLAAVKDALFVWKTEAMKRNMDNEDKCTAKSRTNWRKNLKQQQMNQGSQLKDFGTSAAFNIPAVLE